MTCLADPCSCWAFVGGGAEVGRAAQGEKKGAGWTGKGKKGEEEKKTGFVGSQALGVCAKHSGVGPRDRTDMG